MQIVEGTALEKLIDYSFGDHQIVWNKNLQGQFKVANISNIEFLIKAQEFEGRVMTLYIDNIRLYGRNLEVSGQYAERDALFIQYLMQTNNLIELCKHLSKNQFIIFTGQEDTPIDDQIKLPDNILKIYAVNALFNTDRIIPFPFGLQRQIGPNDPRLGIMKERVEKDVKVEPNKLLYINCGLERNVERLPLAKFETNSWCTTRFDKDSKFYPYEAYNLFLDELQEHQFVVCPKGHGFDTHRIWETLYMRRVPVMLDHPYFRRLLKDFPVLFIKDWSQLTEEFLRNEPQFKEIDLNKLDLEQIYERCRI